MCAAVSPTCMSACTRTHIIRLHYNTHACNACVHCAYNSVCTTRVGQVGCEPWPCNLSSTEATFESL